MSYVDQFIHQLNTTAPHIKQILTTIRRIDLQAERLQVELDAQRSEFTKKLQMASKNKEYPFKKKLSKQLQKLQEKDTLLISNCKQKVQLAQKLYNYIHEPTEKLDRQLHTRGEKYPKLEGDFKARKGKRKGRPNKEDWENDPIEPKYCYCGKPSYGEMVMCENTYCEKQWFHRPCIEEKKLPQKWFCRDCRNKR